MREQIFLRFLKRNIAAFNTLHQKFRTILMTLFCILYMQYSWNLMYHLINFDFGGSLYNGIFIYNFIFNHPAAERKKINKYTRYFFLWQPVMIFFSVDLSMYQVWQDRSPFPWGTRNDAVLSPLYRSPIGKEPRFSLVQTNPPCSDLCWGIRRHSTTFHFERASDEATNTYPWTSDLHLRKERMVSRRWGGLRWQPTKTFSLMFW